MTVDEIYEKIGQEVSNVVVDDNWKNATLNIKIVGNGVVGYTGEYKVGNNNKNISVRNINRDISLWIRELHEITTKNGSNKWNRAVFSITPNGTFDMKFIWDQSLNDEIERLSK